VHCPGFGLNLRIVPEHFSSMHDASRHKVFAVPSKNEKNPVRF
jgi:hypothetical protein